MPTPVKKESESEQGNVGLGYIGETVLQCAITSRLHIRDRPITSKDVTEKIRDFVEERKGKNWNPPSSGRKTKMVTRELTYYATNRDIQEKDTVVSYLALNKTSYDFLKASRLSLNKLSNIQRFIKDSVSYVNSSKPTEHARYFYTNGLVDLLEIESTGVTGQRKDEKGDILTKADIKTTYREGYTPGKRNSGTLKNFNLNLSVKIRGEKQFGQVSGIDGKRMNIFASSVGVVLSEDIINQINKIAEGLPKSDISRDVVELAHKQVMSIMYPAMAENINSGKVDLSDFLDGVYNFMALRDPSINIIDIGSGYKRYVVQKLAAMRDAAVGRRKTMSAKAMKTGTDNWNLNVYVNNDQGSQYVVKLSSRTIGVIPRNYITSGIVLRKWLAELE